MSLGRALVLMIAAVGLGYTVFMPSVKQLLLDLGVTTLFLLILAAGGADKARALVTGRLTGPALALLAAGLLSLLGAPHLPSGARALYHVAIFVGLQRIVATMLTEDERRRTRQALIGVGAASAALALVQIAFPGLGFPWPTAGRAMGSMGNPNFLGSVLAGLLPVAVGAWRGAAHLTLGRVALGATIPLLALGLIASVTRGALLGVAGGLAAFFLLDHRGPRGTPLGRESSGLAGATRFVGGLLVLAGGRGSSCTWRDRTCSWSSPVSSMWNTPPTGNAWPGGAKAWHCSSGARWSESASGTSSRCTRASTRSATGP